MCTTTVRATDYINTTNFITSPTGLVTDNDIVDKALLVVTNGGSLTAAQLVVGTNLLATLTLTNGSITVQQLLATNNSTSLTNSRFNYNGGTLTTSNGPATLAANVLVNSNNFTINGTWNMLGGSNWFTPVGQLNNTNPLLGSLGTNLYYVTVGSTAPGLIWLSNGASPVYMDLAGAATPGNTNVNLRIGSGGAAAVGSRIVLDTNSILQNVGVGYSTTTNFPIIGWGIAIGAAAGAFNNGLIVTNGGKVQGISADMGIGSSATSTNNYLAVTGTNSLLDCSRLIGNTNLGGVSIKLGASASSSRSNYMLVANGGVLTNVNTLSIGDSGGSVFNSVTLTNGGKIYILPTGSGGLTVGAGCPSNAISIYSGSLMDLGGKQPTIGSGTGSYNQMTINGGIVTNTGAVSLGGGGGVGNSVTLVNGAQLWATGSSQIGSNNGNNTNNTVYVGPGCMWTNNGTIGITYGNAGISNGVVVNNGLVYSGVFGLGNGGTNVNYNYLTVTNGASWYGTTLYATRALRSAIGNTVTVGNGSGDTSLISCSAIYFGQGGDYMTNNSLIVNGGRVVSTGNLNVGYYTNIYPVGNQVVVTNGGYLATTLVGLGYNGISNSILAAGSGSIFTNSGTLRIGYCTNSIGSGWTNALGNSVVVSNGAVWNQANAVYVGFGTPDGSGSANSNSLTIGGGGTPALFAMTAGGSSVNIGTTVGCTNNIMILNAGGIFSNVTQVIVGLAGSSGSKLYFNGGTYILGGSSGMPQTAADGMNYISAGGAIINDNGLTASQKMPLTEDPNSPGGGLTKLGVGKLTLTNVNTYTGSTMVNAGKLALSGSGTIGSGSIVVAGGATFDVSAGSFTLGASQSLSNSTSTAILEGSPNTGSGTVALTYAAGTPSFAVTNGNLTLSSSTVFKVNNTGAQLAAGSYKIISALTSGAVVGATLPGVTVGGGGAAAAATLAVTSGELYLNVGSTLPSTGTNILFSVTGGNTLNLKWDPSYLGWELQSNAVSLISATDWHLVPGSTTVTNVVITIDPSKPEVFYRMHHP